MPPRQFDANRDGPQMPPPFGFSGPGQMPGMPGGMVPPGGPGWQGMGPGPHGSMPDLKELFQKMDKDKDGKLSLEEFVEGMKHLHEAMMGRGAGRGEGPGAGGPMGPRGPMPDAAMPPHQGPGPMARGPMPPMHGNDHGPSGQAPQFAGPHDGKALEARLNELEARLKALEAKLEAK